MGVQPCEMTLGEFHVAADGNRHAAFLKHVAIQINLRALFGEIAAGQSADDRQRRVGFVPACAASFAVEMKRINERQPAVGLFRFDAGFQPPIARAVRFLDLFLREMKRLQFRAGQRVKRRARGRVFLQLLAARDQALARTTGQQRDFARERGEFPGPASRAEKISAT